MAFDNFTVNVVSFNETEGVDWTQSRPSVTLTITPNAGYAIDVANFSPINPLPTYVNSVTFSQSGANIECTILYITPSIMPSADVLVALCISGVATLITTSVAGVVNYSTTFTSTPTPPSATGLYSGTGLIGSTSEITDLVVAASSGYYFPVLPTASLAIGELSDYSIVPTLINDAAGNLIQVNFAVNYTFPNYSVTGDNIVVTANAAEIYSPPIEIQSYTMNLSPVIISGETRPITIYGIIGAAWQLTVIESVGGTTIGQFSGTIDSSGLATESIIFPLSAVDVDYTFTLTGDLASTFCTVAPYTPCLTGQPSVWQLYQYATQDVSFNLTSSSLSVTIGAIDTKAFIPNTTPGITAYSVSASKPGSSGNFIFSTTPISTDWTNQGQGNPITNQTVQSPLTIAIDNISDPKTLSIDLNTNIGAVGIQALLSELNLDNFLIYLQPIQLYYGLTETIACCSGVLGDYFILEGETFSSAVAVLLADGTPALDGFYKQ
jgi:hypothetical protein